MSNWAFCPLNVDLTPVMGDEGPIVVMQMIDGRDEGETPYYEHVAQKDSARYRNTQQRRYRRWVNLRRR